MKGFSENFKETEGGIFLSEINRAINDAYELIEISKVDDGVKSQCREFLKNLLEDAEKQKDKEDVYDISRICLLNLISVLDKDDDEQNQLFESIKEIILRARNLAKGWKDLP